MKNKVWVSGIIMALFVGVMIFSYVGCGGGGSSGGSSGAPVNRAPILTAIGNQSVNENILLTFVITGTDPDADILTFSATGLPAGATFVTSTRTFSWTPSFIQSGVYTGTIFTVTDNGAGTLSDSEAITITVNNVDTAPVLTAVGAKGVNENANLAFTLVGADAEGDIMAYTMVSTPTATGATLNASSGAFSWTPSYTQSGSYSVEFVITSTTFSDIEVITITVTNVDRAPVLTSPGDKSINEGQVLSFTLTASDPDNDAIFYAMVGTPTGSTLITDTGVFNWTPSDTQSGSYPVTFTAINSLWDSKTITITVNNTLVANSGGGTWSNYRTITVTNNSGGTLTNYQMLLQPFRDNGDFITNNQNNTGLVGAWSFEDGSGVTATDLSGVITPNDGTLVSSPAWSPGRNGGSLYFNDGNYVSIPDSSTLDITSQITISTWIYRTSNSDDWNVIVCKPIDYTPPYFLYRLGQTGLAGQGGRKPIFTLYLNTGEAGVSATSDILDNQWMHIVCTYDGSALRIYINGVLEGTTAASGVINTNDYPVIIGRYPWNSINDWFGYIDEVKLYNRAISAREVAIQYQSAVKPIGSWSFDEGAGITATDSSAGGNNGTLANGPVWTSGRFGNALSFDGTDDYVSITHTDILNPKSSATYELWLYANSLAGQADIIQKGIDDATLTESRFYIRTINPASLECTCRNDGKNYVIIETLSNLGITTGQWYHIAFVVDDIFNTAYVFINGVQKASVAGTATAHVQNTKRLTIGGDSWDGYFNGLIDDVRIYNSALSAGEVAIRYGSGLAGSWHFSEITGTIATDLSGNRNNGALVNGVVITTTGRFGNALSFDGVDDYVSVPDSADWDFTGANGAVELWFKANTLATNQGLISQVNNDSHWCIYFYPDGSMGVGIAGINEIVSAGGIISTGNWYHVVVVKNGSTTSIYVNGSLVASGATAVWSNSPNPLRIGGYTYNSINYHLNGLVDEVRIYKRALSASEIALRYNSGAPKYNLDCSDIRFTSSDASQEYSYWQETDTKFWVKIPSLPAGNTAIRMHYGNVSATAVSSGTDTFVWFDDFNRANNDTIGAGYTEDNVQCNWNINNNMLRWTESIPNGGFTGDSVLNIATEPISHHKIRLKRCFVRTDPSTDHAALGMLRGTDRIAAMWYEFHRWNFGATQYDLATRYTGYPYNGGTQYGTTIAGSVASVGGIWQNIEVVYHDQQVKLKINENLYTFADDLAAAFDRSLSLYSILIDANGAADLVLDIDDLIVSQYSEIEPTGAVSGAEQ